MIKILFTCIFLCLTQAAFASNWYIRSDGDDTVCAGSTDAAKGVLTGSGQACAKATLYGLVRHRLDNSGASFSGTTVVHSGDTIIAGKPDGAGGSTDQFIIGYDPSNGSTPSGCTSSNFQSCYVDSLPSGIDSDHKTKLVGRGWDTGCTGSKAQFWGSNGVGAVIFNIFNNNIQISCLDITDHSSCIRNYTGGGTSDGFPNLCVASNSSNFAFPAGPWAKEGMVLRNNQNVDMDHVNMHGVGEYGLEALHQSGTRNWNYVRINENGYGGINTDDISVGDDSWSGTTTMIKPQINRNGCGEHYPLVDSSINSEANIHHCWSQGENGYGDGWGMGDGSLGDITIYQGDMSWNVQEGFDCLHCQVGGNIIMSRSVFQGNGGNQIKFNNSSVKVENSLILGNCGYFEGRSFAINSGLGTFANCRSNGTAIKAALTAGKTYSFYNNTITSNGDVAVDISPDPCSAGTLNFKNNIVLAGEGYFNAGAHSGYIYNPCGSTLNSDYNQVYGTRNGSSDISSETHSRYTDPLLTGESTLQMTTFPYYQGTAGISLVIPSSLSPARYSVTGANSADETLTFSSYGSTDYFNTSRGSNWDGGGLQYGSSVAENGACWNTSDCGTGTCTLFMCTSGAAVCGNNTKESGEVCDGSDLNSQTCVTQGFGSGTLACSVGCGSFNTSSCVAAPVCGNNTKESGEVCDGSDLNSQTCVTQGFASGSISCSADCLSFVTSSCVTTPVCGNNIKESGEVCDGTALNSQTCTTQGYSTGTLACAVDCGSFNITSCANTSDKNPWTGHFGCVGKVILK